MIKKLIPNRVAATNNRENGQPRIFISKLKCLIKVNKSKLISCKYEKVTAAFAASACKKVPTSTMAIIPDNMMVGILMMPKSPYFLLKISLRYLRLLSTEPLYHLIRCRNNFFQVVGTIVSTAVSKVCTILYWCFCKRMAISKYS